MRNVYLILPHLPSYTGPESIVLLRMLLERTIFYSPRTIPSCLIPALYPNWLGLSLPDRQNRLIMGGNAERLFGICDL